MHLYASGATSMIDIRHTIGVLFGRELRKKEFGYAILGKGVMRYRFLVVPETWRYSMAGGEPRVDIMRLSRNNYSGRHAPQEELAENRFYTRDGRLRKRTKLENAGAWPFWKTIVYEPAGWFGREVLID